MNNMLVDKPGAEFDLDTLGEIKQLWKEAWPNFDPGQPPSYARDRFFVLRGASGAKILAVGRLRQIKGIQFLGRTYDVLGVADIVAVVKGQGFGSGIVKAMHRHLASTGRTGIGFCHRENSGFYGKCGFEIGEDLVKNFVYRGTDGTLIANPWGDRDILYVKGDEGFVDALLANPSENVIIPGPHW